MDIKQEVYDRVIKFMVDNQITCEETVYQCDWVIEDAYGFIGELFNLVEEELSTDDEE